MKLILDENLSPSLVARLADLFPGSTHVVSLGLGNTDDGVIWDFAKKEGFTITSKDSDYVDRGMQEGPPPKVIAITLGNCTTGQIESLLRMRIAAIRAFAADPQEAILFLP
jgi:predicted nuclease of predicted toxin-antitoxin system